MPEKHLVLFLLVYLYVAGLRFGSIVFRTPSWGSGVFSSCCIYVPGLMWAVLFYPRVVVLCSVDVA